MSGACFAFFIARAVQPSFSLLLSQNNIPPALTAGCETAHTKFMYAQKMNAQTAPHDNGNIYYIVPGTFLYACRTTSGNEYHTQTYTSIHIIELLPTQMKLAATNTGASAGAGAAVVLADNVHTAAIETVYRIR